MTSINDLCSVGIQKKCSQSDESGVGKVYKLNSLSLWCLDNVTSEKVIKKYSETYMEWGGQ